MFTFFKGRVALYAILKAMGVKHGDEVILPGFTCIVVSNAIIYLGAIPVYIDIDPDTYNIDPVKLEDGKGRLWQVERAKVIIAQHTFGIPAAMDKICQIAKKYNLYVIEDSCHALGSKYKDKEVGKIGDAAFFSSQWSKPITTGLGGWTVVNSPELKGKIKKIHEGLIKPSTWENLILKTQYIIYSNLVTPSLFWFAQNTYRAFSKYGIAIGSSSIRELEGTMPKGYEKKMSIWQREILENKFKEIDKTIAHRKWVTSFYEHLLKKKGLETAKQPKYCETIFLRYPFLVKNKKKVLREAQRKRIELGDWFLSPVHPNLEGWEKAGYRKGTCPVAEEICHHIINLPTHPGIGEKEIKKTVEFIAD